MLDIQTDIRRFTEERDWQQFHTPENLAKSISIEAGELLECFQWNNEYKLENVKEGYHKWIAFFLNCSYDSSILFVTLTIRTKTCNGRGLF